MNEGPKFEPSAVHVSVVALVRDEGSVLMVESNYPGREPFWALPGGRVEGDEALMQALVREVKEETGLRVSGSFPLTAVIHLVTRENAPDWFTFIFEPENWDGSLSPNDPDSATKQAAFLPVEMAIDHLNALSWGLSEPIVRRLKGAAPGSVWTYAWDGDGPFDGRGPARLVVGPSVG